MSRKSLGSLMEDREAASDPSPEFEERSSYNTYYDYNQLTPDRMQRIFRLADNQGRVDLLYRLYDDMEHTDTRYSGILNQLRSTIARMPLRVMERESRKETNSKKAEEFADYAREVIEGLDSHSLTQEFAEPYIRGANLYKIGWEQSDLPFNRKMWFPSEVETVDGEHLVENTNIKDDTFGELEVRLKEDPSGFPISDLPFDNHLFLERRKGKGKYSRLGVARKITPWYLSLRFIKTWWVQYIENYGSPLRIGKYPRGSKKSKRKKMKQFLRQLGQNGYGLFPSGMDVEMIDLNRQGKVQVHKEFIDLAHKEYSIHILGQAGTTGEGREGSYAQSVVLNGIRMDIIQNVAEIVSKGFKKLIRKGLKLNYGDEYEKHLVPEIKPILLNSQDSRERAKAAQILSKMGFAVPENYVYENILGTEKPQKGEIVSQAGKLKELSDEGILDVAEPVSQNNGNSTEKNESLDEGEGSVANNPQESSRE